MLSSLPYFLIIVITISLIESVLSVGNPSKIDWCAAALVCEKNNEKNYACGGCPLAEKCNVMTDVMTVDIRSEMLKAHNTLRNKVAIGKEERVPEEYRKATNMRAMSYDSSLEYLAECWLKQCKFEHTSCQNLPGSDDTQVKIGQNLFTTNGPCTGEAVIKGLNSWYESEIDLAKIEIYTNFAGGDWGHYTQVIWAKTDRVGCSVSKDESNCILACNYASAGNFLGQPIYDHGEPASKCTESGLTANSNFAGLCGNIKEYDDTLNDKTVIKEDEMENTAANKEKSVTEKDLDKDKIENKSENKTQETKKKEGDPTKEKTTENIKNNTKENSDENNLENNQTEVKQEAQDHTKSKENTNGDKDVVDALNKDLVQKEKPSKIMENVLKKLDLPWITDGTPAVVDNKEEILEQLDLPWITDKPVKSNEIKLQSLELPWIPKENFDGDNKPTNTLDKLELPWLIQSLQQKSNEKINLPELDLPWMKNRSPGPDPDDLKVFVTLPALDDLPWIPKTIPSVQQKDNDQITGGNNSDKKEIFKEKDKKQEEKGEKEEENKIKEIAIKEEKESPTSKQGTENTANKEDTINEENQENETKTEKKEDNDETRKDKKQNETTTGEDKKNTNVKQEPDKTSIELNKSKEKNGEKDKEKENKKEKEENHKTKKEETENPNDKDEEEEEKGEKEKDKIENKTKKEEEAPNKQDIISKERTADISKNKDNIIEEKYEEYDKETERKKDKGEEDKDEQETRKDEKQTEKTPEKD